MTEVATLSKKEIAQKEDGEARQQVALALVQTTLTGDWSKVPDKIKAAFVEKCCNELKIPLVLNPFRFIKTKNGEKFYAPAEAAALILNYNEASVTIVSSTFLRDEQIYSVVAECSNGKRKVQNIAFLSVAGTSGQDRANAYMKCTTKAIRRAVLSAYGLSARERDTEEEDEVQTVSTQAVEQVLQQKTPEQNEDTQARLELFDFLLTEGGMTAERATKFVFDVMEKALANLTAAECQEVYAKFENFNEDAETPKSEPAAPVDQKLWPTPDENGGL